MAFALAAMFCLTASAHFGKMQTDLERMVPPWIKNPGAAVFWSGILEILGVIVSASLLRAVWRAFA